jgi:hypothetical protein
MRHSGARHLLVLLASLWILARHSLVRLEELAGGNLQVYSATGLRSARLAW